MMKHEMRMQKNVRTKVIPWNILNKKEIAPYFLMSVTDLHYEHPDNCIFPMYIYPSVTGHKWVCLVNRTGPSNR